MSLSFKYINMFDAISSLFTQLNSKTVRTIALTVLETKYFGTKFENTYSIM